MSTYNKQADKRKDSNLRRGKLFTGKEQTLAVQEYHSPADGLPRWLRHWLSLVLNHE
jgi:hypothetical protein